MKQKIIQTAVLVLVGILGFAAGQFQLRAPVETSPIIVPQIGRVALISAADDGLKIEISGAARVTWGSEIVEGAGEYFIPISQLPNASDLLLAGHAFVGNKASGKYYPTDSYHARGTAVADRRYFATEAEAQAAGFMASKAN